MGRTTSRTLFVWSDGSDIAYRAVEYKDGLFKRLGSGTVVDMGGDPADWKVATSDHMISIAMNDQDGFKLSKGTASVNRILSVQHVWKTICSLGEFAAKDHPLNATGNTIEKIREAYKAYRTEVLGIDA